MSIELFNVTDHSGVPKYKQIINSLIQAIENGQLKKGDKIPSINAICKAFSLSRDTVLVAFNELKARGVVNSVPGKGYYIESVQIHFTQRVFLLFDELNAFKEILYNSFLEQLKGKAVVDIFFHHFNRKVFKSLIENSVGGYTSYVIMPAKFKDAYSILKQLPEDKVFILDQTNVELKKHYPSVHQNFEKDVYDALISAEDLLTKYKKMILVFPSGKEPLGQMKGFQRFCHDHSNWEYEIITSLKGRDIQTSEVYIVPSDKDLVDLVKKAHKKNLILGQDMGIISYNDTPLKEVVADGITTISTDFAMMGENLAHLVLDRKNIQMENPSFMIRRSSL